jgi:uncharacterized protein (TIGR03083 family)
MPDLQGKVCVEGAGHWGQFKRPAVGNQALLDFLKTVSRRSTKTEGTMETPKTRVQLLQVESERLGQYLHSLPPDAWSRPSACHRWAVRDVVGHLIMGAELYSSVVSRGLQKDVSPLEGFPEAGTVNAASASAFIDQLSVARRENLGDHVLSTFNATSDQLNQLLAGLGPHEWETPCYHPAGLLAVRTFVDLRLTELVMHGWDIRSRLEPEAPLLPASLPAFLDVLAVVVGWAFWPGTRYATPVRYRFEMTGTVPTRRDIVVAGDQARMEPVGAALANVTCHCATETFVFLMYGRLTPQDAITDGRMTVDGEAEWVTAFAQWFRGV